MEINFNDLSDQNRSELNNLDKYTPMRLEFFPLMENTWKLSAFTAAKFLWHENYIPYQYFASQKVQMYASQNISKKNFLITSA